jgi:hypothetical protein
MGETWTSRISGLCERFAFLGAGTSELGRNRKRLEWGQVMTYEVDFKQSKHDVSMKEVLRFVITIGTEQ